MKIILTVLFVYVVVIGGVWGFNKVQAWTVGTEQGAWLACQNAALAQIGSVSAHDFPYKKDSVVSTTAPGEYWVRFATHDQTGQSHLWSCTATVEKGQYRIAKLLVNPPLPVSQ